MIEDVMSTMLNAGFLAAVYFAVTFAFNGRRTFRMTHDEYYLMPIFIMAAMLLYRAERIQSTLDAMNTCGTAEVVVSGEGE